MDVDVVKKAIRKLIILGDSMSFVNADSVPDEEDVFGWIDMVDEVRDSLKGEAERALQRCRISGES